jgi:hypothetical protein
MKIIDASVGMGSPLSETEAQSFYQAANLTYI